MNTMYNFKGLKAIIILLFIAFTPSLSAQNYLSKEREDEIKTSGRYYWDECADFNAENARQCASTGLSSRILVDVVNKSLKQEEILKAIGEMEPHVGNLQQKGKVKILAWIAKDSVFVTTQKPITKMSIPQPTTQPEMVVAQPPAKEETPVPPVAKPAPVPSPSEKLNQVVTDNPVLQELAACKNHKEVNRVARTNGLVRGSKINSSEGFANPEKCIIAVFFTADDTLAALLDIGSSSRTDLLSGKTVQNPEQHYKGNEYYLWYLQQKK
ncbi:hypothetical protein FACS1894201_08810 [Bacteroidia bacterium]|nr:hypothetical protein FACS1894201_08810 [Bacteroidia bacterium]